MATTAAPAGAPHVIVTRTALVKLGKHVSRMQALNVEQVTAWLIAGMKAGDKIPPERLQDDVMCEAILLPTAYVSDTGERLVALCTVDRYNPGASHFNVVTTVKRARSVLAAERTETPPPRVKPATPDAPPTRKVEPTPRRVKVSPIPIPEPVSPKVPLLTRRRLKQPRTYDNRGAQLARMELAARRGIMHRDVAHQLGIAAGRLSHLICGRAVPDIDEAIAFRDGLGVPLEAWGEDAQ